MKPHVLDTNVIIRFLVGDNKLQQKQAAQWFYKAQKGEMSIIITPIVIAEVCFVLESFYKKKRDEIAQKLELLVSQRWLTIHNKDILLGLWSWYRKGFHFVDSFLISLAKENKADILTFDKKILKLA